MTLNRCLDFERTVRLEREDWARLWNVKLGEEIHITPMATSKDWKGCAPGTTKERGKNHPELGRWLLQKYSRPEFTCLDPFLGVGGFWIRGKGLFDTLIGYECEESVVRLVRQNLSTFVSSDVFKTQITCNDSRAYYPGTSTVDLIITSHPFRSSHTSGATQHQKDILKEKNIYNVQEFRGSHSNIGRHKKFEPWLNELKQVFYLCEKSLKRNGKMLLVSRNHTRGGKEVDDTGVLITLLRYLNFEVSLVHYRTLLPTFFQAGKIKRDPSTPYTKTEWVIEATKL